MGMSPRTSSVQTAARGAQWPKVTARIYRRIWKIRKNSGRVGLVTAVRSSLANARFGPGEGFWHVPFGKLPSVLSNFRVTNEQAMLSDASLASWAIGESRFVVTAVRTGMIRRAQDLRSIRPYYPPQIERRKTWTNLLKILRIINERSLENTRVPRYFMLFRGDAPQRRGLPGS